MVGSTVLVVEVVAMFPDVDTEEWFFANFEWIPGVRHGKDFEFTVGCHAEPCPSGAKKSNGGFGDLFFEGFE